MLEQSSCILLERKQHSIKYFTLFSPYFTWFPRCPTAAPISTAYSDALAGTRSTLAGAFAVAPCSIVVSLQKSGITLLR